MNFTHVSVKRLALVLVSVAMLSAAWLCAAEEQPRKMVRLYNAGPAAQEINAHGGVRVLAPGTHTDLEVDDRELLGLALPATVIAVERLPLDDRETDELHVLHIAAAATCAPTVPVRVPLMSCRFGTAEAQVQPIAGASYRWTVEGGAILSGDGTPSVLIGFGGASSALAQVTVTQDGCASTGAAVLNLRNPLTATVTVADGNVGTPARVSWTYNTTEPILTQILQLPDQAAPIRLAQDVRSYVFTPTAEGSKTVKLTAALYRIGARRRAVSSGSGPRASSCSFVETQRDLYVKPPCSSPTVTVTGGGTACGSAVIRAQFTGTPPFSGRWSDGVSFETTALEMTRSVKASATYRIDTFDDAACSGRVFGSATVQILSTPDASMTITPDPVSLTEGGELRVSFTDATACALTSALGNTLNQPACSGTGIARVAYPRLRQSSSDKPGTETLTLRVDGPCGHDIATTSFFMCDYLALTRSTQSSEICEGQTFTFTIVASSEIGANPGSATVTSAGPPFSDYRVYRCALPQDQCTLDKFTLVQAGGSDSFSTTLGGWYIASMRDRLGCPSILGAAGKIVTVKNCP
jgi:hypothetical protein